MRATTFKNVMVGFTILQFIITMYFYCISYKKINKDAASLNSIEQTVHRLEDNHSNYKKQIGLYHAQNEDLNRKLVYNDRLLQFQKEERLQARGTVIQTINSDWDALTDDARINRCDSLREQVLQLEAEQQEVDSLTGIKINTLSELNSIKDQQISICDSAYNETRAIAETAIGDLQLARQEQDKLERKLKRKERWNKVWKTTAVVLTAVTTAIIITNQ